MFSKRHHMDKQKEIRNPTLNKLINQLQLSPFGLPRKCYQKIVPRESSYYNLTIRPCSKEQHNMDIKGPVIVHLDYEQSTISLGPRGPYILILEKNYFNKSQKITINDWKTAMKDLKRAHLSRADSENEEKLESDQCKSVVLSKTELSMKMARFGVNYDLNCVMPPYNASIVDDIIRIEYLLLRVKVKMPDSENIKFNNILDNISQKVKELRYNFMKFE